MSILFCRDLCDRVLKSVEFYPFLSIGSSCSIVCDVDLIWK